MTLPFLHQNGPIQKETKTKVRPPIPGWAFTSLTTFEKCPYEAYLKYGKKIYIDQSDNAALTKGNKVHDEAENYVKGNIELTSGLSKFETEFGVLQNSYHDGKIELEEKWGVDKNWNSVEWSDSELWGRIKLDAFIHESETSGVCIDYKTGKKFGNEFKHLFQNMVYIITAFSRFPKMQLIEGQFWYLDHGEKLIKSYTRQEADILKTRVTNRALKLTTATKFPPNPSKQNCKFCDFKKSKHCEWAE
jgi:CRISPR/Cas system-associated exonuclease Cas4 (RecB family)